MFTTVDFNEKLISSKTLDSISLIDLIVAIEDHLNITIPTVDVVEKNFDTINAMADYLRVLTTSD